MVTKYHKMTQKDIIEIVKAPVHTDETLGYMESKISEQVFRSVPRGEIETESPLC